MIVKIIYLLYKMNNNQNMAKPEKNNGYNTNDSISISNNTNTNTHSNNENLNNGYNTNDSNNNHSNNKNLNNGLFSSKTPDYNPEKNHPAAITINNKVSSVRKSIEKTQNSIDKLLNKSYMVNKKKNKKASHKKTKKGKHNKRKTIICDDPKKYNTEIKIGNKTCKCKC